MKPPRTTPVFAVNPSAASFAEGLRAGIAIALPVIAGVLFGLPDYGLAALGALLTCFADPGGTLARRVPAVVAFALLAGLVYAGFGMLRGIGIGIGVTAALAGLMIFCTSFARIYGQGGLQVGNLLTVVTVLALDRPLPPGQAAAHGLNLAAGAAWAVLLTLLIWRIHPYAPARRALATVSRRLSRLARELAALADAEESVAAFAAHAARHRGGVRMAIEASREVAYQTFRRRGLITPRAAQLSVRLQTLEQVFGDLVALSEILENNPASRPGAIRPIRLLAGWLAALGPDIEADRSIDTPKKRASLHRLRGALARLPDAAPEQRMLQALAEHLAVLMTISTAAGQSAAEGPAPEPWRRRLLGPIRQNLSPGSAGLRHGLRAGCIAALVLAWTMSQHSPFAHWTTITMVLCLQPQFSATWARSLERIGGTMLGGVLAALLGLIVQSHAAQALAMLPLTVFAFAIRGVSFTAFMAALTPMIVLLIEQIAPGANELTIATSRVGYTVLGGLAAVLANLMLWPQFEGGRVAASITAAIAAHAAYVDAVFTALLDGLGPPDAARRAAGLASNNLEASLSRAVLEPHRRRDPAIERGAVVDAALRRLAGRLSVLALDPPPLEPAERPLWRQWQGWIANSLTLRPTARPALPAGAGAETLTRLARQVELIGGPANEMDAAAEATHKRMNSEAANV